MLRSLTFLTFCLCLVSSYAQEFIVKEELTADQFDVTAQSKPRKDLAGHACALVKVWCALDGVRFTGNTIGDPLYSDGEYWVYVTQGSKQLTIRHARVLPTTIHFAPLQGGVTYRLTLQLPESLYGLLFNPTTQPQPAQPELRTQQSSQEPLSQQPASIEQPQIATVTPDTTFTVNDVSFKMIRVEGGTFQMGSDNLTDNTKPVHEVTLSTFFIGETEVTKELWQAVMGYSSKTAVIAGLFGLAVKQQQSEDLNLPADNISYKDCQKFIEKLNSLTGCKFRLPTEAEWEFAARGGNLSNGFVFSGSNEVADVGWYKDNSDNNTHPVKSKQPNELGIYDMTGNVCEWCANYYYDYSSTPQTNPTGPEKGDRRVVRGGSSSRVAINGSNSYRDITKSNHRAKDFGLRLALDE